MKFEIAVDAPQYAAATQESVVDVLRKRIKTVANGRFELDSIGDSRYMLTLRTAFSESEMEDILTSPGKLQLWEPYYWEDPVTEILSWGWNIQKGENEPANPDFKVLASYIPQRAHNTDLCTISNVSAKDYPKVMAALDSLKVMKKLPVTVHFGHERIDEPWDNGHRYNIYLFKHSSALSGPVVDNSFIEKLSCKKDILTISFNEASLGKWRDVTRRNSMKQIAFCFDDEVLMTPTCHVFAETSEIDVSSGPDLSSRYPAMCVIVNSGILQLPVNCERIEP